MSQERIDVEGLLAAPRLIFDRVSENHGGVEEINFPCAGIISPKQPPYRVRPLTELTELIGHYGLPSLVFLERIYSQEYSAHLQVLAGIPRCEEDLSMSNFSRPKRLLRVCVGKIYDSQNSHSQHEWRLSATAEFGLLEQEFSFIGYGKFWPLVSEVLSQFAEATAPFDGEYRFSEDKVLAHA